MTTSTHSADVTHGDFETLVIATSRERPVVADFWAAWCGPCRTLMPMLAKLADEYAGKFFLAKINTDMEQELAARYNVRSLPTVKVFRNGNVVDEFMGAQPEPAIRQLLDRHIPRESDALVDQALAADDHEKAAALLAQAAAMDPANNRVKLAQAQLFMLAQDYDAAESALQSMTVDAVNDPQVSALKGRLAFARVVADAPPLAELERAVNAAPDDLNARQQLSARLVLAGNYAAALENLLEIVRRDRGFNDDAGRKGLLAIFALLGNDDPLVKQYRGRLAMALN